MASRSSKLSRKFRRSRSCLELLIGCASKDTLLALSLTLLRFVCCTWSGERRFEAVCAAIKAKGVTPLTASVDGAWPSFIWFEQLLISQDPKLYLDLTSNKIKYTDPKVVEVFNIWKGMIDKGWFTAGDTSFFGEEAVKLMNRGTMIPVGTWNNSAFSGTGGLIGGKD